MRFGIAFKIGVFAALVVVCTAASIGFLLYRGAQRVLVDHELVDLQDETRLKGALLVDAIDTLREDALYLASLNEIDALVRAHTHGELKPDTETIATYMGKSNWVRVGEIVFKTN